MARYDTAQGGSIHQWEDLCLTFFWEGLAYENSMVRCKKFGQKKDEPKSARPTYLSNCHWFFILERKVVSSGIFISWSISQAARWGSPYGSTCIIQYVYIYIFTERERETCNPTYYIIYIYTYHIYMCMLGISMYTIHLYIYISCNHTTLSICLQTSTVFGFLVAFYLPRSLWARPLHIHLAWPAARRSSCWATNKPFPSG